MMTQISRQQISQKTFRPTAVVRGVGDVGSAVAWMLHHAGFQVIAHENRQPRTIRRKMAFCDALWTGDAELAGVTCHRMDRLEHIVENLKVEPWQAIALYTGPFRSLVEQVSPAIIVDARIQKFSEIENLSNLAPFSIGVGPGFAAGKHVDAVIESCWGDELGEVITQGQAMAPVNQPPSIDGVGWERFVRASKPGRFQTKMEIGVIVRKGDVIGHLGDDAILAPISGHIRGLLFDGLSVVRGEKVCEIDPRLNGAHYDGLAERPKTIALGVLEAIERAFFDAVSIKTAKSLKVQDVLKNFKNVAEMC